MGLVQPGEVAALRGLDSSFLVSMRSLARKCRSQALPSATQEENKREQTQTETRYILIRYKKKLSSHDHSQVVEQVAQRSLHTWRFASSD